MQNIIRYVVTAVVAPFVLLAGMAVMGAGGAQAQVVPDEEPPPEDSTRAGRLRHQRVEKRRSLEPSDPGFFSEVALGIEGFVERNQLVFDLPSIDVYGIRPVLGGLRSGSGTTGGLRLPFYRERDDVYSNIEVLASLRSYYGVQGVLGREDGDWLTYGYARYWHMPEEDFYGIGPKAGDHRANYRLNEAIAGGLVGYELLPGVLLGAHASYQTNRYGPGQDSDYYTIEEAFPFSSPPGAKADVDYLFFGAYAEYDSRDVPYVTAYGSRFAPTEERLRGIALDATEGLYFAAEAIPHHAIGKSDYSFTRFNFESQQYIPFRHAFEVLALREFLTFAYTPGDNRVPLYEMVTLGGSRTLRGFNTFRFRDRGAVLLNAEFRWQVLRPLDLALFVDAGHVFSSINDLGLSNPETSYGIGFRLKKGKRVIARLDISYSREGLQPYLKLGSIL